MDRTADAHLKRIASRSEVRVMGREVVVAVTNGRLDMVNCKFKDVPKP